MSNCYLSPQYWKLLWAIFIYQLINGWKYVQCLLHSAASIHHVCVTLMIRFIVCFQYDSVKNFLSQNVTFSIKNRFKMLFLNVTLKTRWDWKTILNVSLNMTLDVTQKRLTKPDVTISSIWISMRLSKPDETGKLSSMWVSMWHLMWLKKDSQNKMWLYPQYESQWDSQTRWD